jgi:hypothetical protein
MAALKPDGEVRLSVIIISLLKKPSLLPQLLQAQRDFRRALAALQQGGPLCVQHFLAAV